METMYKLTTIAVLFKRVRRRPGITGALAGLLFLAAVAGPAQAQATNTYRGLTVINGGSLGVAPGQSVSVSMPNFVFQDGSVRFVKHTIKVYAQITERESNLVYSGESGSLPETSLGHIFTFGRLDLAVPGEPGTSRVQIWIEVESFLPSTKNRAEVRNLEILPPTFELIDDLNDKTVIFGTLLPAIIKVEDKNGL
jgi:hypothetical protein